MPQSQPTRTPHAAGEDSTSQQPVERFHDGRVHVSIWEHAGIRGTFRTASFQLRYRDKDQQWQTGTSYSATDLTHLEDAAREARYRIKEWQRENATHRALKAAS